MAGTPSATTPVTPTYYGKGTGVIVYIDGFNLYYGSLKGTPYRWLDVERLAAELAPGKTVHAVHYFTARVKWDPRSPTSPQRQGAYLNALKTLPTVRVKEGSYIRKTSSKPRVMPLWRTNPKVPNPANGFVDVWVNEEKGSDVNLATQLLLDACDNNFAEAVVITNDSDLAWPIRVVRRKWHKRVNVYWPDRPASYPSAKPRQPSYELRANASSFKPILEAHLAASPLPSPVLDATGQPIHKPAGW